MGEIYTSCADFPNFDLILLGFDDLARHQQARPPTTHVPDRGGGGGLK